jgi:hypothetical protein
VCIYWFNIEVIRTARPFFGSPLLYDFQSLKFKLLGVEELAETNNEDNWWPLLEKNTKAQSDTYRVQR